jgi:hypothetical protein
MKEFAKAAATRVASVSVTPSLDGTSYRMELSNDNAAALHSRNVSCTMSCVNGQS